MILCTFDANDSKCMTGDATEILWKAHKFILDDLGVSTWMVHHESRSCGNSHHYTFRFVQRVMIGQAGPVHKAVFHLVNCHDRSDMALRTAKGGFKLNGRLKLDAGNWLIVIDQAPNHDDLVRELNQFGGQAITHITQISRKDGTAFEVDLLNDLLTAVRDFVGFATGSKPQICLGTGFDTQANRTWDFWAACGPSTWSPLANWTSDFIAGHVSRAFPGYFAKLQDSNWKEPISLASDWYVQAKHRGLETALVLGQAALELLAATLFEQAVTKPCTEKEWDSKKWPASKRIRWLLQSFGVDVLMPPRMTKLRAFTFSDGKCFEDGPHALTELRNAIAHPKKQKRERFGPKVDELRIEAAAMVLFFLEQALLAMTGFDGLASADATHGCSINFGLPAS